MFCPWHTTSFTPNSHRVRQRITHAFTTFHTMYQCMFRVGTHLRSWWCTPTQCEHNYSLPIYFAFYMRDTYFWCAVTLVCMCVDALGVNWGSSKKRKQRATLPVRRFRCDASGRRECRTWATRATAAHALPLRGARAAVPARNTRVIQARPAVLTRVRSARRRIYKTIARFRKLET